MTTIGLLVLLSGCGPRLEPVLIVAGDSKDIDTALADRVLPEAGRGARADVYDAWSLREKVCPGAAPVAGTALYLAWILPPGVPDPAADTTLRVETACTSETLELPFEKGAAQTLIAAPDGSDAGLLVTVSALNGSDGCQIGASADTTPEPVTCSEEDDTDTGTGAPADAG